MDFGRKLALFQEGLHSDEVREARRHHVGCRVDVVRAAAIVWSIRQAMAAYFARCDAPEIGAELGDSIVLCRHRWERGRYAVCMREQLLANGEEETRLGGGVVMDSYLKNAEERGRRGRYMVIVCSDVGVPYESAVLRGLGAGKPKELTHAQDIAGGFDELLKSGWRFVAALSPGMLVFERAERDGGGDALLESLKAMHRRAQASEGAAVREKRLRAGFARERAQLIANTRFWEKRYHDLKLLMDAEQRAELHRASLVRRKASFWSRFF